MRPRSWYVATLAVVGVLLIGGWTLVGEDSPYVGDVDVESYPRAPDKPTPLDSGTVGEYLVRYEQRLLTNDLYASRGHTLDSRDRVVADCRAETIDPLASGEYRVQVRCRGGIDDHLRLFQPGPFTYSVTYRVTANRTRQTAIQGYPFDGDRRFNEPAVSESPS